MQIIQATSDHISKIVEFNLKEYGIAAEDALDHFEKLQWWGHPKLLEWHFSNLRRNGGGILAAIDENGEIIGQLDYVKSLQEERYHIIWLLVDKEARRKGVATALIAELQKIANHDGIIRIWTEAEDERTEALYQNLGKITDILENYWIDLNFDLEIDEKDRELVFEDGELVNIVPEPWNTKLPVKEIKADTIDTGLFKDYHRIIGDYLTPEFDLSQLISSIHSPATQFIWGETPPMQLTEYALENGSIIAILTQYVRVFQKGEVTEEELQDVVLDIIHRLVSMNFLAVDIQILQSRKIGNLLQKIGFAKVEEDPVFEITAMT